jgi:heme/copper-type cytochrome/quinol oxidase subunit 2
MLAVPQIEEALKPENNASFSDRTWLWYIVLAVPITVVALLVYISWEYLYKRKYLKSLFGESGSEKNDEVEMLDLERGRGGVAP